MTQYPTRGGIDSFAVYKEESVYGTNPGTWTSGAKSIGMIQSVTPSLSRNLIKVRGLSGCLPSANTDKTSRDAQQILAGKFDASLDIEYQPQNFEFLKYVFGSVSGTNPYYYPQESASTDADKKKYLQLPSISVATRYDFGGSGDNADKVWIFTGLKVNTFTMKAAMGEPISCSVNMIGNDLVGDATAVSTNYPCVALSSADVFNFVDASAEYGGSPINNIIDGFEFTVGNNVEVLAGLGEYKGKAAIVKFRDFTVKLDLTAEGTQFMDDFMGSATGVINPTKISTMKLKLAKASGESLTINLVNLKISDDGLPQTAGEVNKESITLEVELAYVEESQ